MISALILEWAAAILSLVACYLMAFVAVMALIQDPENFSKVTEDKWFPLFFMWLFAFVVWGGLYYVNNVSLPIGS